MIYDYTIVRYADDYYALYKDGDTISQKSFSNIRPYLSLNGAERKESDRLIMYSISGTDKNGEKCLYNLRIRKDQKERLNKVISDLESRCTKQDKIESHSILEKIKIKQINWKRLAIIALSCVLVASTPAAIKATKKALKEDYEDWHKRNSAPDYAYENPNLNPELEKNIEIKEIEKKDSKEYDTLLARSLDGDSEALNALREQALSGNDAAQTALVNYLYQTSVNFKDKTR